MINYDLILKDFLDSAYIQFIENYLLIWHRLVYIGYLNIVSIPRTLLKSILWSHSSYSKLEQSQVFHNNTEFLKAV